MKYDLTQTVRLNSGVLGEIRARCTAKGQELYDVLIAGKMYNYMPLSEIKEPVGAPRDDIIRVM